ncbi:hypothetical protein TNIN_418041 [Trichonephila inaurata madagascariensis]|uniref:Uncharacterized protein n=1 Tax=Trichonephila inaurata madagascariensis TaxID=2747483 RepID=A0A8X6Y6V7_9ARAC|nr:hypothetical protein TNIN_418041 [Trichonephila inaurata madagascariensis]
MDSLCQTQIIQFGKESLGTKGCPNSHPLDSIGSNGVGCVLWTGMARYHFSSARLPCLSESNALARKDALWSQISQVLPRATPEL